MRTPSEIANEIAALRALKPAGPFSLRTQRSISAAIDELAFGLDQTADEWFELTQSERAAASEALAWKRGDTEDKPSTGWGPLAA